jgi:preprotein translocase subunit YajC
MKITLNILSAILLMFIIATNIAFADTAAAPQQGGVAGQVLMMVLVFGAMYFVLIKPQNKKAKEHRELLASVNTGDEVITAGGMLGKVIKVMDSFVVLGVANGVEVVVQKQAIAQMLPKDTIKSI